MTKQVALGPKGVRFLTRFHMVLPCTPQYFAPLPARQRALQEGTALSLPGGWALGQPCCVRAAAGRRHRPRPWRHAAPAIVGSTSCQRRAAVESGGASSACLVRVRDRVRVRVRVRTNLNPNPNGGGSSACLRGGAVRRGPRRAARCPPRLWVRARVRVRVRVG